MSVESPSLTTQPASTISLSSLFLGKLDREAVLIRKALERVPEGRGDFKPHERSMELGYLASLVAGIPSWIPFMIDRDELSVDDPSSQGLRTRQLATREEMLEVLDRGLAAATESLAATTDEHLMKSWAFKMGGRTLQEQPRHIMISDAVFSHLAHHRGQLTVYLRLVGSAVPALYGPSADEMN